MVLVVFWAALMAVAADGVPSPEVMAGILTDRSIERSKAYMENARGHMKNYERALQSDGEMDLFMHCWAATQQLMAAMEFGRYTDPSMSVDAIRMAGELLDSPEGAVIKLPDIVEWATRTAIAHPATKPELQSAVLQVMHSSAVTAKEKAQLGELASVLKSGGSLSPKDRGYTCLLYTSDAADEEDSVDLGGRRIIKKKKKYIEVEK
eukprot:TRINITY_DN7456_c0_g1_i5.p1 TRINITY_DN7456_c0_g1~~TRINITY_DN7456_c0_g1_i5.p1  ORF type:complete len:207 (-),score=59.04 TRINITY_DN7456_c0_g1_i5:31-651(-)